MIINIKETDLKNFIVVGDRVLIKPKSVSDKTQAGLYLPPTVKEKEQVHTGYIVKVGPGYPIPAMNDDDSWRGTVSEGKYIPLQAKEGDLALYLNKSGYEIEINKVKYLIVPQSALLLLFRDEGLFEA
ncbi:MAG: co-chaperone GroES [Bacteroidales bacterium]|nr:co-chaperone GroES [Bacteroidales bacterium]